MLLALVLTLLAPAPPAIGTAAPGFTLTVRNPKAAGVERLSTRQLIRKKRPLAVDFMASWCAPCKAAIPGLITLAKAHPSLVVAIVITDEDAAGRDAMLALLADFPGPVLVDPHRLLARRYGADTLPFAALTDEAGTLVWVGQGAAAKGLEDAIKRRARPAAP